MVLAFLLHLKQTHVKSKRSYTIAISLSNDPTRYFQACCHGGVACDLDNLHHGRAPTHPQLHNVHHQLLQVDVLLHGGGHGHDGGQRGRGH